MCDCDCTNGYCCPPTIPGYIAQPFHIPGYCGHIPTMRDRKGGSYGKLSRDVLEDPCAVAAPCPLLLPECCNRGSICCCCCNGEDRFECKGSLAPRCCESDVYRCCEPMNESYMGHVPAFFPCNWGSSHGRSTHGTKIFIHNAGFYNSKYCFRGNDCPPFEPAICDNKYGRDRSKGDIETGKNSKNYPNK